MQQRQRQTLLGQRESLLKPVQAQAILDLAMALCHGEDPAGAVELVDGHYVWLPYQLVTRENLALFQQGGG